MTNLDTKNNSQLGENWVINILPFIDGKTLTNIFNLTRPIPDPANALPRGIRLAIMLCPSDAFNDKPFNGTASSKTNLMGDNWARGNYGANASLGYMGDGGIIGTGIGGWGNKYLEGVMGANVALRISDIHD